MPYTGATASLDMGANNLLGQNFFVRGDNSTSGGFLGFRQFSGSSSGTTGYTSISALQQNSLYFQFSQTNGTNKTFELSTGLLGTTIRQYQLPDADGTIALTSNIPSVSGAVGQVSYFNGTNSITGSNDLFFDAVNGHLGIGTITPGTALDVKHDQSTVVQLEQITATNDIRIAFINSGVGLWRLGSFYNAGANDFGLFDIAAATQPVTVKRTTGQVLIGTSTVGSGKLVVASSTGDNGVQIVGASAPSLRIDNAESGPTKRAGLGISTATNNFIQGSADRDFCMFNGSTTASPILFGIYDTTNVQEAARISAARNLLVGGTVDNGSKLQVSGTITSNVALFSNDFLSNETSKIGIAFESGYGKINSWGANTSTFGGLKFQISASNGQTVNALTIAPSGAATFISSVNGTIFDASSQFRITGNNVLAVTTLGGQNIVKINSAGYYGTQIVGANDTGILVGNTGNTLIGTTTDAGQKLQVNGSTSLLGQLSVVQSISTDYIATIQNTNANSYGVIIKSAPSANNAYPLLAVTDSTGTAIYMRVDSGTGNVSIGTNPGANSSLRIAGLPTSPVGLASGEVWNNLGVLSIV